MQGLDLMGPSQPCDAVIQLKNEESKNVVKKIELEAVALLDCIAYTESDNCNS